MGLVWVACGALLDVNASYGPCHPTISRYWLLHYIEYVEQISWSPCSALLYLASQPASRRAEPIVCLLNLHIFHLDVLVMKNKSNKDLRWPLLELLKSSKILFTV